MFEYSVPLDIPEGEVAETSADEDHQARRREERRVQGEEGRGHDPAYDPEHPESPGDTGTAR